MTVTTTSGGLTGLPDHLHAFALTHMAMRRDALRLVGVARSGGTPPWATVADWWSHLRRTIEWHHHSEDTLLWPALRAAVPEMVTDAQVGHVLDEDHHALDRVMAEISAALGAPDPADVLPGPAAEFARMLPAHLDREEQAVFPAFLALDRERYLETERRVVASAGPALVSFVLPWMFDSFERWQVGRAADTIPPPVRLISVTVLRRRYLRLRRGW